MRTLIKNGLVVTADGSFEADVLVATGRSRRSTRRAAGAVESALAGLVADETIDATGKYVVPGGIDGHTHFELPFGGTFAKDTFESGTKAAAHGGTTTIVDFAVQPKGQALREGLDVWMAKAEGNAVLDYGFHMIMSDVNDASLAEMDQLVAEGIPDFKLFTAYPGVFFSPDDHIFRAMKQTREERRPDPDARRERPGDRRDRRRSRGERHDRPDRPRPGPLPGPRGRGDEPGASAWRRRPAPRSTSSTSRRATRWRPCRPRATAGRRSSPRRARSTSSCRSTTSATGSRARSTSAARRSGRRTTRRISGAASAATTSSSSARTTARSTSRARRSWAGATSGRSRTACRPSRTGSTCSTTVGVVEGRIYPRALGRDHGHQPRQDVRDVPAEGRDRGRLGRRHPGLRPEPEADDQRRRPTTWTSTTRSSRAGRSRARPTS